jgi:hypothetical protein
MAMNVNKRADLAHLCNARELYQGVEVGTELGIFARDFLQAWRGYRLWCVDSYEPYPEMPYDRTPDLLMACQILAPFAPRVKILKAKSDEVANGMFKASVFGFVYIDGAHDYASVKADLATWWPHVQRGGMLAGHDFDEGHPGVMQAVKEFARQQKLSYYLTRDNDTAPSWWIDKP